MRDFTEGERAIIRVAAEEAAKFVMDQHMQTCPIARVVQILDGDGSVENPGLVKTVDRLNVRKPLWQRTLETMLPYALLAAMGWWIWMYKVH